MRRREQGYGGDVQWYGTYSLFTATALARETRARTGTRIDFILIGLFFSSWKASKRAAGLLIFFFSGRLRVEWLNV